MLCAEFEMKCLFFINSRRVVLMAMVYASVYVAWVWSTRRVHDNISIPLWVYIRFAMPEHLNETNKNMYIARARAQFRINTHTLVLSSAASGWDCVFDTISAAWSERAGQLAAGGVASVWRSWARPCVGLYASPCARASESRNKYVCMHPFTDSLSCEPFNINLHWLFSVFISWKPRYNLIV